MPLFATSTTLRRAHRMVKHMNVQGTEWQDLHEASQRAVEAVLREAMEGELLGHLRQMDQLGQPDRRNGSYRRHLLTTLGNLELVVPRTRTFSGVGVIRAYARREHRVDQLILGCFLLGLSTRKVGTALLPILGERVSAPTVSRISQGLDAAVAAWHRRPLKNRYRVLLLDGVLLSRRTGSGALRRPVLVAMGITHEGKKEILDFQLAPAESQHAWEIFLSDLQERGLTGEGLELIATDGGLGMLAALPTVYPRIPVQRCWAHKTRNILDKARDKDRKAMKRDLHRISHAEHRVAARKAARRFADRWEAIYPRAVACLRDNLDELLCFFRFENPEWRKAARTTNAIERRFREVRRRTRPMGVFSDRTSMERILFAIFIHENQKQGTGTPFQLLTHNS